MLNDIVARSARRRPGRRRPQRPAHRLRARADDHVRRAARRAAGCRPSASCRGGSGCRRRRSARRGAAWPTSARSRPAAATARTSARRPGPGGPRRYRRITEGPGHFELDLSSGTPDPALLPDLGPVVSRVGKQSLTSSYLDHPVLPALEDELVASWPFAPEAITVVDGAMDALDRVAQVVLRLGDRVVVEHPGFPPLLDLLDQLGCDVVGVDVDDEGLVAGRAAATPWPTACGPCSCSRGPRTRPGSAMTARRAAELAGAARRHATRSSSRTTTPTTSRPRRWSASAGGCRTGRCTSAATPRATGRTCGWPPSAGPATSSPPSPTAACSVPAGRAGSCRRCCWSCCRTRPRRT